MRFGAIAVLAAAMFGATGCGGGGEGEGGSGTTTAPAATAGDPARGKQVFATSGCGSCHAFAPAGSTRNVGPDLGLVAKKYDAQFIRTSIVDPSAFLEKGSEGKIGGDRSYGNSMPAYGPEELPPQQLTEQQLRDLVAFIESAG